MSKIVDYDEMFGTGNNNNKKKRYEERRRMESAERNEMNDSVESFRKRTKSREGFFERSDSFSDNSFYLQKSRTPMTRLQRDKYVSEKMRTDILECIDGIAVGIIFAVIAWKLYFGEVYTTIAGAVGFVLGSVLKLLIRDRFPIRAALRQGLSYIPVGVLFTLIVAVLTGCLKW